MDKTVPATTAEAEASRVDAQGSKALDLLSSFTAFTEQELTPLSLTAQDSRQLRSNSSPTATIGKYTETQSFPNLIAPLPLPAPIPTVGPSDTFTIARITDSPNPSPESRPPSAGARSPSKQPRRMPSKPSISPRASTADSSRITLPQTWTNNARVVLEDQIHSLKSSHSSVENDLTALKASLENVRESLSDRINTIDVLGPNPDRVGGSTDVLDAVKELRHDFVQATKSLGEQLNVVSVNVDNTRGLLHKTVVCVTELQNYAQAHHQQIKTLQASLDNLSASHDALSSVVENDRAESRATHALKRVVPHEWDEPGATLKRLRLNPLSLTHIAPSNSETTDIISPTITSAPAYAAYAQGPVHYLQSTPAMPTPASSPITPAMTQPLPLPQPVAREIIPGVRLGPLQIPRDAKPDDIARGFVATLTHLSDPKRKGLALGVKGRTNNGYLLMTWRKEVNAREFLTAWAAHTPAEYATLSVSPVGF